MVSLISLPFNVGDMTVETKDTYIRPASATLSLRLLCFNINLLLVNELTYKYSVNYEECIKFSRDLPKIASVVLTIIYRSPVCC